MDYTSNFEGCGGKLVDYSGNFYSTGYPKPYDNNLNCEWQLISPEKDQSLIISIKDLNVSNFKFFEAIWSLVILRWLTFF